MTMTLDTAPIPMDATPFDVTPDETPTLNESSDYDPAYPGSTPDAPYGYKPDGTPYKRRPRGTASGPAKSPATGTRRMAASETSARAAANMLGRMNSLIGFSLVALGMPNTAGQLAENNETFVEQAYEALLTDPELCRKIMSAGAQSGKAQLMMAYAMLGASVVPTAVVDIKEKRALAQEAGNDVE